MSNGWSIQTLLSELHDDIQVVFRHLPLDFHPNAKPSAKAAEAARLQGKFWEMHDKLFANQQAQSRPDFDRYAKEIGLKADQITKLKAMQLDLNRTRIKTEAEIQVAELELAALADDEKADLSAIEAQVKQSEMLEVGLRRKAIKAKRDARALLTPEQRGKEEAEHEKMMRQMRRGRGGGMGGGMMEGMEGMGGGMMGGGGHGGPPPAQPKKEEHPH